MGPFSAGEQLLLDRSLKVEFMREIAPGQAIVSMAGSTHVVPLLALSRLEG
jgi:hypothetical protein